MSLYCSLWFVSLNYISWVQVLVQCCLCSCFSCDSMSGLASLSPVPMVIWFPYISSSIQSHLFLFSVSLVSCLLYSFTPVPVSPLCSVVCVICSLDQSPLHIYLLSPGQVCKSQFRSPRLLLPAFILIVSCVLCSVLLVLSRLQ